MAKRAVISKSKAVKGTARAGASRTTKTKKKPRTTFKRSGGRYFKDKVKPERFIKTGSTMLDLSLGGGWCRGRIANVVGDRSSGKTLLMIEACANFAAQFPKGKIYYREAESAFDKPYARALGMPIERVDFGDEENPFETIEDLFKDLKSVVSKAKPGVPSLYIVDSLDALSDESEMSREFDAASYGGAKAKKLSELFRRLVRKIESKDVTVIIVSQIRDKIGAMFGRKVQRTGGRALDFYATHIVFLAQLGKVYITHRKQKRAIGVKVKAQIDKNKVSVAHREVEFDIRFGYGVNDAHSMVAWLRSVNCKSIGVPVKTKDYLDDLMDMKRSEEDEEITRLRDLCKEEWVAVEEAIAPRRTKYAGAE